MKTSEQPAWLQAVVSGLAHPERYSVVIDASRYAIIRQPGGMWWSSGSGPSYARTKYVLVEKGINYWHGEWREVGEGRLTKALMTCLSDVLAQAEKEAARPCARAVTP